MAAIKINTNYLICIYLDSSQPPLSIKLATVAFLIRKTLAMTKRYLLETGPIYRVLFKGHFMRILGAMKASLFSFKRRSRPKSLE